MWWVLAVHPEWRGANCTVPGGGGGWYCSAQPRAPPQCLLIVGTSVWWWVSECGGKGACRFTEDNQSLRHYRFLNREIIWWKRLQKWISLTLANAVSWKKEREGADIWTICWINWGETWRLDLGMALWKSYWQELVARLNMRERKRC